jgi:hypothetical protein
MSVNSWVNEKVTGASVIVVPPHEKRLWTTSLRECLRFVRGHHRSERTVLKTNETVGNHRKLPAPTGTFVSFRDRDSASSPRERLGAPHPRRANRVLGSVRRFCSERGTWPSSSRLHRFLSGDCVVENDRAIFRPGAFHRVFLSIFEALIIKLLFEREELMSLIIIR